MKGRSLVSITDCSKDEMLQVLDLAAWFEKNPVSDIMRGRVVATLFFEPSTRTRLSFESAVNKLGGSIIGFSEAGTTSVSKGESLKDTIRTVANYSDLIVMRHPLDGSARYASEVSVVPVVNAGDGANQHPSQTLLDLYSIRKTQQRLDGLRIGIVGDLKYGRTVHSLLIAMSHFAPTFYFVSQDNLRMPTEYTTLLNQHNIQYTETDDLTDVINEVDILYVTRVQRERFSDPVEYEKTKNAYVIRNAMLRNTRPNLRILHPLPRVNELNQDVDDNPKAYYYEQMLNGVFTRQAIIASILGLK